MEPNKKTKERPFYEAPSNLPTSSKIINEARTSLRSLKTKRPFTPRDENRTLFGPSSSRAPENRPPSAFSLGARHFDGSDSRPVSGTRLTPLEHTRVHGPLIEDKTSSIHTPKPPLVGDFEGQVLPPKPPSDPNRPVSRKGSGHGRSRLQHSNSVDSFSTAGEVTGRSRTGSIGEECTIKETNSTDRPRRVHSGPKERTENVSVEERGVGDGKECPPRLASAAAVRSPPTSASKDGESRAGSGGSKRSPGDAAETPEEKFFYTQHIGPLVEEMLCLSKKKDTERISELADSLYIILHRENLLGRNCKKRSHILKTVFKLLDAEEPKVLLQLAKIILALKVSGNNLTNVCKLVFKVSRNEKNDQEFMEGNVLDHLVETIESLDHTSSAEALVYCVGSLKFLSGNMSLAKLLVKKGGVEALSRLLTAGNRSNTENNKASEQFGNILVQLTAALRNLADVSSSREKFLSGGVVEGLCKVMEFYAQDSDIMLNSSRTFSKLTLHTDCCNALSEQRGCFKSFLHLLNKHLHKEDLIVRVCFVLGNLTAKNEFARSELFQEPKSLDTLLSVFKTYLEKGIKTTEKSNEGEDAKEIREVSKYEDVLIKVVRVIANLSISEDIGPFIASSQPCLHLLLNVLDNKDESSSEELVLNIMATINNLSFYPVKTSAIMAKPILVAESLFHIMKLVLTQNMEAMIECARVFGNLTRQKTVRDYLYKKKICEVMITLLDSGSREVVYVACGVLINMMADEEKRPVLKREGGVNKLLEVLRDFGKTDWQLASMVCQVLWNYSGKINSANACFGDPQAQELSELLVEMLDEEAAMDVSVNDEMEEEVRCIVHDMWKADFCPVASQLLHRIDSHQSKFEPLEPPP
ncbi:armadillo repeat-containing protein 2-like [Liolophura sinensis]|uniref:armadillo repeat-containing protein 2-like n=1 Tax=Liolophura sinensis TaxID=3198878 RepID=UPI0031585C19